MLLQNPIDNENERKIEHLKYVISLDRDARKREIEKDREKNVFTIHEICGSFDEDFNLLFLMEDLKYYKFLHLLDNCNRTWLHCATNIKIRNKILQYLVETIKIDPEMEDVDGYTALHYACQHSRISKKNLEILIRNENSLLRRSKDGKTPIDLLFENKGSLNLLIDFPKVPFMDLLDKMEMVSRNVDIQTIQAPHRDRDYTHQENLSILIAKNDKLKLLQMIKSDPACLGSFHLFPNVFVSIARKYFDKESSKGSLIDVLYDNYEDIETLSHLINKTFGIHIRILPNEHSFFNSLLFFALLMQSFSLVPVLLQFCPFNVISYALMSCWTCDKLVKEKYLGKYWKSSFRETKEFCEKHAVSVLEKTIENIYFDDVFLFFLTSKIRESGNKTILDIAFESKCSKFISNPMCQKVISILWMKNKFCIDLFDGVVVPKRILPRLKECIRSVNTTYRFHLLSHVMFLCIFSYFMTNLHSTLVSPDFIFTMVYSLGYFVQECVQLNYYRKRETILSYFKDRTNTFDIGSILFVFIGFILLMVSHDQKLISQHYISFLSRVCFSLSLLCNFVRLLHFALNFETIGPKLKMMGKMIMIDLIPQLFVFAVFITCFGVIFQSLLIDSQFYNEKIHKFIMTFKRSTFTIFTLESLLTEVESSFQDDSIKLMIFYFFILMFIVLTNVLLMNLLIALFSNTVTEISQQSQDYVNLKRFAMLKDYKYRTYLPPPLNIFELIVSTLRKMVCRRKRVKAKYKETENENKSHLLNFLTERTDIQISLNMDVHKFCLYFLYQTFSMTEIRRRMKDI